MSEYDRQSPDPNFVALVRSALMHLYDPAYMQNHPLVARLVPGIQLDRVTRAQELRRTLLECIGQLHAGAGVGQAETLRAYTILTCRYVDGLSMEEIGAELGLSERSLYRAHKEGLQAVACLLWDRMKSAPVEGESAHVTSMDRLEAGQAGLDHLQPTISLQPVELQPTLQKVLAMLAPLTAQTGARIIEEWAEACPAVLADRVMLRQALVTLLSHALGRVQGSLNIAVKPERGGALITIEGQQAPLGSPPIHPAAPEPASAAPAVAQALIEAQGGRLEIQGSPERWQARVHLPGANGATILVVDDNAGVVALFRRYLSQYRITIVAADGGQQALRLAAELQPQLIILDVMMPNEDGWEILQRLKNTLEVKGIPVIVCSVLSEPALALSMGASGYITKPVARLALLEELQHHLGPLPRALSPQEE